MRFPFYRQLDPTDCGPTCLRMIASHYGRDIPSQWPHGGIPKDNDGVSLLDLSDAAESLGFTTQAVRLSYETLASEAPLPCILYWKRCHYVVLYKIVRGRLYLADPLLGFAKLTKEEFLLEWTNTGEQFPGTEGVALFLQKKEAVS
jgi:ATP-binding cassette subfamily B protein